MRLLLLSVVLLASCKSDPPPPPPPPPPSASALASALAPAPALAPALAPDILPPIDSTPDAPSFRIQAPPFTLVSWSTPDDTSQGSRLLAGFELKPGQLNGSAKILRRTSGRIAAIDILDPATGKNLNADYVVAWVSDLLEGKGQLIAMVTTSRDLSRVTPPVTIGIVASEVHQEAHVSLAKNPRGGVIVAHQGASVKCPFGPETTDCLTFDVKAVSPAGVVTKLGQGKLQGGPSPDFVIQDLDGKGAVVYATSMRGGRTLEAVAVPYDANDPALTFTPPMCGGIASVFPSFARGKDGEMYALCTDNAAAGACARPLKGDRDRCLKIAVTASDGHSVTPKSRDAVVTRVECTDAGFPRYVFAGGAVTPTEVVRMARDFIPPACQK